MKVMIFSFILYKTPKRQKHSMISNYEILTIIMTEINGINYTVKTFYDLYKESSFLEKKINTVLFCF